MSGTDERPISWEDDDRPPGVDSGDLAQRDSDSPAFQTSAQATGGPASTYADMFADAAHLMKCALDFMTEIFGEKWAEKAARAHLQLTRQPCQMEPLTQDVALANSQVEEEDEECRQLKTSNQARLDELDGQQSSDARCADLLQRVEAVETENIELQKKLRQTSAIRESELFSSLEATFGARSELCQFIRGLDVASRLRIGYACMYSLPRSNAHSGGEAQAAHSWHAMVTLGKKFLDNVYNFDGPGRGTLLSLAAEHLSRTSQMFTFSNEEGQTFHSDRHVCRVDNVTPPGARIRRIICFLVTNKKTRQVLQKAEVEI